MTILYDVSLYVDPVYFLKYNISVHLSELANMKCAATLLKDTAGSYKEYSCY